MQRSRDAALEIFVTVGTFGDFDWVIVVGGPLLNTFLFLIPGALGPPVAGEAAHRRQRPQGDSSELLYTIERRARA